MEPRAPSFFGTKPNKPYCAAARSCSQWEVDSYRRNIDNHIRNLRTYADDVDRYYKSASEYIECMADLD